MPTGAELFVRTLKDLGIGELFTLVGDHLNEVLAVAAQNGLRLIDMRHESGVTHAADTWGRIHRRPAVGLVTGGPGHTNALTGLATAQLAGSPVILVSGSRATSQADRGAFQDLDQVGMAKPVTKWAAEPPTAAQIPFYLCRAYSEANSGRRGATHLTIPVDLFAQQVETPARFTLPPAIAPAHPDPADVSKAIALLQEAKRPLIIAGGGAWWANAGAVLRQFIERTSLPLFTVSLARGAVSDVHPLCFGYADPAQSRAAYEAFRQADVILVLGKRLDFRLAMGAPRLFDPAARFIQVDIHSAELGLNRDLAVAICADVRLTLKSLLTAATESDWPRRPWVDQLVELRRKWTGVLIPPIGSDSLLHPAAFYTELRKIMPEDVHYAWDGGDFAHWGRCMMPASDSGSWVRLGPLGAIGSALPNGIALQLAYPNRPVAVITGDGSLGFYIAELDTAVRHGLPIIVIVGNDGSWGLERELQEHLLGSAVACELRRTRYDIVTQGFGGAGEVVERVDQIEPAFQRALASKVPYCLNVMIRGVRSPFTEWQIAGKKS